LTTTTSPAGPRTLPPAASDDRNEHGPPVLSHRAPRDLSTVHGNDTPGATRGRSSRCPLLLAVDEQAPEDLARRRLLDLVDELQVLMRLCGATRSATNI
jgi:hypothetical protein